MLDFGGSCWLPGGVGMQCCFDLFCFKETELKKAEEKEKHICLLCPPNEEGEI